MLQALKFCLFSASAGIIQLGSYAVFHDVLGWAHFLSYLVSLVLSVLWNFTFNRKFTFHSSSNVPKAMLLVAAYYCVFTPVSTIANKALSEYGVNPYVLELSTMAVNFVTEFFYQKYVVFREKKKPPENQAV